MKVLTKRFLISDLFNVNTGSLVSKKRLSELADKNGVPRISVTTDDNGQIGHYTDNKEISNVRYFRNFITINFFGKVYYHPSKASVEMKVHVLTLKSGKELTREVGMYLVTVLRKTFDNSSYNYGNQLSSSKIRKGQYYVELPVTPAGQPDFAYMTARIRELEAERIRELEAYLHVTGLDDTTLSASEAQALTQKVQWKKFKLGSLLNFESVRQAKSQKAIPDDNNKVTRIPYIVQSMSNNMFRRNVNRQYLVDHNEPIVKGNCIALGVTLPAVSYQPDEFGGSQLIIGRAKDNWMNPETGLFLTTAIKMHMPEFSYNRKPGMKIYKNMDVELPVTPTGDIDFDYMQNYIRATEKQTIKGVVEYKDRVIAETKKVVNEQ